MDLLNNLIQDCNYEDEIMQSGIVVIATMISFVKKIILNFIKKDNYYYSIIINILTLIFSIGYASISTIIVENDFKSIMFLGIMIYLVSVGLYETFVNSIRAKIKNNIL